MSDKRKVSTDALETLGMKIGPDEKRDAIHLAVIPVEAGEQLWRCDEVGIAPNGKAYQKGPKLIGVVDPFIKVDDVIEPGEWFWLVIYPRQITSLRHVWTHPDVPDDVEVKSESRPKSTKEESEAWIRQFIASHGGCPEYETLVAGATGQLPDDRYNSPNYELSAYNDGEYLTFYGADAHGAIPPEFWDHIEVVGGKKIEKERRAESFSCTC